MDFVPLAQSLGVPVATAAFFVWWLKNSLSDRITVLEKVNAEFKNEISDLNKYIRDDQARIISEAHLREAEGHAREKELVDIIRKGGGKCPLTDSKPEPIPSQAPSFSEAETDRIIRSIHDKHIGKSHRALEQPRK